MYQLLLLSTVSAVAWRREMNPGMMLRVDEYSVNAMKSVL
jgi:hypothetical protein